MASQNFDEQVILECCGVRRVLAGALEMMRVDKNLALPEITEQVLQDLVSSGYMKKVYDDPGQGPGTQLNFYVIAGHSVGVGCKVHGVSACAAHLAPQ